jgi:hypothetical protein
MALSLLSLTDSPILYSFNISQVHTRLHSRQENMYHGKKEKRQREIDRRDYYICDRRCLLGSEEGEWSVGKPNL